MFATIVHFVPVLAAEKSKVPYYIAGGLLVAWALFVSLGLGLRNPNFPGSLGGQRIVSAITAVLVIAAASTAVITSGGEEGKSAAETAATPKSEVPFGANPPDPAAPESATANAAATTSTPAAASEAPASSTPASP